MTVRVEGGQIHLEGNCTVEDAEVLTTALEAAPAASVDLSQCRHMHGAVVQAIIVFHPRLVGVPMDRFIQDLILPALAARQAHPPAPETPSTVPFPE